MNVPIPAKKTHRFFIDRPPGDGPLKINEGDLAHQIRDVIKLRAGENLILVAAGREHLCRIIGLDRTGVEVEVAGSSAVDRDTAARAVLYCAVIKKENFELVVQKTTETGIGEIVPVISRRTVKLNVRMDRLASIAREAAEQCGRTSLPLLHEPLPFVQALAHSAGNRSNWFFDPSGKQLSAADLADTAGGVGLFIGPEGGWDQEEIAAAVQAGCRTCALGRLILRAETAAIAASYLACWPPGR